MSLQAYKEKWSDTPAMHRFINDKMMHKVNETPYLKAHRDWVEQNIFGFGERSFHWMWKLIVDDMPELFTFLEVGVFRGQVLSLIELLAKENRRICWRYGVTPLNSTGGHWESDYTADIEKMHDQFGLAKNYGIFKGLSTDATIIKEASRKQYHIVYIDGGHSYDVVRSDLKHYLPLVKVGGILVVDDCCNRFNLYEGAFAGIDTVSKAVDEVLPPFTANPEWEFLFSVVHNRVYRKL